MDSGLLSVLDWKMTMPAYVPDVGAVRLTVLLPAIE